MVIAMRMVMVMLMMVLKIMMMTLIMVMIMMIVMMMNEGSKQEILLVHVRHLCMPWPFQFSCARVKNGQS